uniref:(northern house mosquito) hypothetical protein n=1 Tax=Culex pipiens TaxID=7175 RepID=A0A8D8BWD9_CULPI
MPAVASAEDQRRRRPLLPTTVPEGTCTCPRRRPSSTMCSPSSWRTIITTSPTVTTTASSVAATRRPWPPRRCTKRARSGVTAKCSSGPAVRMRMSCRRICWTSRSNCWSASTAVSRHATPPSQSSARSGTTRW